MKAVARYTFQHSYPEYKKTVKDPLSWDEYQVVKEFFEDVSRALIHEGYEYKIQPMGGFFRIDKNDAGWFYHLWDKNSRFCRIPKSNLWSFRPCRAYSTVGDIGLAGLRREIIRRKNDPYSKNYDVLRKRHRKPM